MCPAGENLGQGLFADFSSEWILMRGRRIAGDWRHQVWLGGVILLKCNRWPKL
jgi:hypothetical protein